MEKKKVPYPPEVGLVPGSVEGILFSFYHPLETNGGVPHLGTHPLGVTGSRGYHLLVVVVVLVSNNKCIMEKKRCHSIQEVGLVPVGPRKVFYFLLPPIGNQWRRSLLGTHPLGVTVSPRVPPFSCCSCSRVHE
ncbi:hypothetical protein TNCV_2607441 [Trichonephila clavipes]|uniref:Uncharacterized protein n=1 Tax=Trichonephila clavipes TaxID=2585209 RepID=A0A8X6RZ35_TRICX|nr:hypothetical protein TNCV_2607441 [Trichonephila clavipes]